VFFQNVSFLKLANGIASAWKKVSNLASLPKKSTGLDRKRVLEKKLRRKYAATQLADLGPP